MLKFSTMDRALPTSLLLASLLCVVGGPSISCTRDVQRPARGSDQNTAAVTGGQTSRSHSSSATGSPGESQTDVSIGRATTSSQSPDSNRAPASTDPDTSVPQGRPNPAIPRDEKGIPGSPYASDIRTDNTGQSPMIGGAIDLNKYPYAQKDQFKNDMSQRLKSIDNAIEGLEASKTSEAQKAPKAAWSEQKTDQAARKEKIQSLASQRAKVAQDLKQIDSVPASQWDSFKSKFRNDVVQLESNYQGLTSASNNSR